MPRIRSFKPEFFLDADVAALPPLCRLFYMGLWLHADKEGRLRDNAPELKVRILPYDDMDAEIFLKRLEEPKKFSSRKRPFIIRYESGGIRYLEILSFKEHQVINKYTEAKSAALPPPPKAASTAPGTFEPDTDSPAPSVSVEAVATKGDKIAKAEFYRAIVETWNDVAKRRGWVKRMGSLPPDLQSKANGRAREHGGHAPFLVAFKDALDGAGEGGFLAGENDRGWRANIEWALRPKTIRSLLDAAQSPQMRKKEKIKW